MSTLQNNIASLEALITKANALPEEKTIQSSKTVTPTTSSQTIKPDSGYDGMGQVVVNAMPTGRMGPTDITVSTTGLITAQPYVDSQGYITQDKMETGTKQLTTQAAKTITPTKSSQTAVAKNVYTTGAVTVAAIPSQYITTTDASAAADDIVTGETAYVNGVKVTGTNPYEKAATDTEVAAQATTIEEIMELLEGKSVPGGGEDVTAEVTAQSALIDDLEAAVDALPDAGDGEVETCTVQIGRTYDNSLNVIEIAYMSHGSNGYEVIVDKTPIHASEKRIITVAKNSIMVMRCDIPYNCNFESTADGVHTSGLTHLFSQEITSSYPMHAFRVDNDAWIFTNNNSSGGSN